MSDEAKKRNWDLWGFNLKSIAIVGVVILAVSLTSTAFGLLPSSSPDEPLPPRPSPINVFGTLAYSLQLTQRNAELGRQLKDQTRQLYDAMAFMDQNAQKVQELIDLNQQLGAEMDQQATIAGQAGDSLQALLAALDEQVAIIQQQLQLALGSRDQAAHAHDVVANTLSTQQSMLGVLEQTNAKLQAIQKLTQEMQYYARN